MGVSALSGGPASGWSEFGELYRADAPRLAVFAMALGAAGDRAAAWRTRAMVTLWRRWADLPGAPRTYARLLVVRGDPALAWSTSSPRPAALPRATQHGAVLDRSGAAAATGRGTCWRRPSTTCLPKTSRWCCRSAWTTCGRAADAGAVALRQPPRRARGAAGLRGPGGRGRGRDGHRCGARARRRERRPDVPPPCRRHRMPPRTAGRPRRCRTSWSSRRCRATGTPSRGCSR